MKRSNQLINSLKQLSYGNAGIAQLVEQLICNQQVVGSNPTAGSFEFWIADLGFQTELGPAAFVDRQAHARHADNDAVSPAK